MKLRQDIGDAMRMSTDHGMKTKYVAPYLLAAALALACTSSVSAEQGSYDLSITFDLPHARIIGTATIDAQRGAELPIDRGDLRILSLTNGSRRIAPDTPGSDPLTLHAEGPIQIRYEGTFSGPEGDVIDGDKIVLRQTWYPVVEGTYRYHLTATLPRDFVAISEADTVRRTEADGQATFSFDLPYPQRDWDGITLVASRQPAISLTVPITIYFERGRSEIATLQISGQHLEFRHLLDEKPIRVALDENYDVFRHLTPAEMPPTIDNLLTRSRVILVASPDEEKKFAQLINAFASEEAQVAWYGWGRERAQKAGATAGRHTGRAARHLNRRLENPNPAQRRHRGRDGYDRAVAHLARERQSAYRETVRRPRAPARRFHGHRPKAS